MPASAAVRLVTPGWTPPMIGGAIEVHARGATLLTALVTALIESLTPGSIISQVEASESELRPTDIMLVHQVTGRVMVVFGTAPDNETVSRHLARGTHSLIGVDASRDELTLAINSLTDGPAFVSASIVRAVALQGASAGHSARLTEREAEVAKFVVAGYSNREIADELCVSANTVRSHLQSISGKLGVRSRAKLAVRVRELNLA